jgi:uncharacterized protein (DUF302 family)
MARAAADQAKKRERHDRMSERVKERLEARGLDTVSEVKDEIAAKLIEYEEAGLDDVDDIYEYQYKSWNSYL